MRILGLSLGVVSGICFGIGLFHLFIGLRRRRADLKHVTFGGFALCYGGSVLGGLLMYQAPSLSRYVVHDRWSGLLVALTFVSLTWFVTVYTASVSRWVPMLLTALFCAVATAHVTRPALVYAEIAGIVPLTLPWGEQIMVLEATDSAWFILFLAGQLLTIGFVLYASLRQYRSGDRGAAVLLAGGMLLFVAAIVFDVLVDGGVIDFILLADFGFLPLAIAMSLQVSDGIVRTEEKLERSQGELERRVVDRTRELAVLHEIAATASQAFDLDTMLARSLERVLDALGYRVGGIHVLEADGPSGAKTLRLAVHRGLALDLAGRLATLSPGEAFGGWVYEHDELLFVPDTTSDPRLSVMLGPSLSPSQLKLRGYIGVPLRARGQVLGALGIARHVDRPPPSVDEISLLTSVGDQLGVMIESARLREQARQAAVLEERERLARELHDSVTQLLYSINLFGRAGRDAYDRGDVAGGRASLARLGDTAVQAMKEMRLLLHELRGQDAAQEGLVAAIQQRLDAVERRAGVEAALEVAGTVDLPAAVERELFSIVREALNNALKHAGATSVRVWIHAGPESLALEVADDGAGFDPQSAAEGGGMGLATMRERAERLGGTLDVSSEPGRGTTVRCSVQRSSSGGRRE